MSLDDTFSSVSSEESDSSSDDSTTETYEIEPRAAAIPTAIPTQPSTSNESSQDAVVTKKRGRNKVYELTTECQSIKDAIDFVKSLDSVKWTRSDTRKTQEGEKRFYTCIKGCPKRLYILLNAENENASVYVSDDEHEHQTRRKETTLPTETRDKVHELLQMGTTKSRQILKELERKNLPMITKLQLKNIKAYWKKKN